LTVWSTEPLATTLTTCAVSAVLAPFAAPPAPFGKELAPPAAAEEEVLARPHASVVTK
jgi:hypothetical protein